MNASARTVEQPAPGATTAPAAVAFSVAEIDASCRGPLLLLFASGAVWLLVGTVLHLIAGLQIHGVSALAAMPAMTFGRVRPAAMNALIYGFAIQTILGILTWIICRLGRMQLLGQQVATIGGAVWNLG